ncbi:MAG TPA: STAS domain-containing protein [Candidatus Acidoferrales bacterium]|nr:STAS domain-containing protein [Candidatus Acidoferrales bacterium]
MSSNQPTARPHELKLQTSTSGGVTTVHCSGRLTAEVSLILKNELKKLIPEAKHIVLDLTDLSYMDSAGLGTLVGIYVSAKRAGCELQLINLNQRVRELLGLTHLLSVFESAGRHFTKIP